MRIRFWHVLAISFLAALGIAGAVVTQPLVQPLPSQPPPVDAARLRADVEYLSVDLYPRSYDQLDNIERAAQFIAAEFTKAGAVPVSQDVPVEGVKYRNVIARFGPEQGPLLVIGAHYDSHGDVSRIGSAERGFTPATHTPGADDNASGVAALLELARLLGRTPPSRPVELVAYTLEEPPHFRTDDMGSAWHARALRTGNRTVELMLSLEMIGYFDDTAGSQRYPVPGMSAYYPDQADFIAVVGRVADFGAIRRIKAAMAGASDLPVYSINAPPSLPGIDFSDHLNYWQQGYPALMITDTAFLRSPHYHRATDTAATLDYARMAKVVQGVYAVIERP